MGRKFEEIAYEVKTFRELNQEERKKRLKAEQDRLEKVRQEIVSTKQEISEGKERLKSTQELLESTKKELEQKRAKRQDAIASGQSTKTFDAEIKKLIGELEEQKVFCEDSIIGLQRRIEALENRLIELSEREKETEKTILRFQIVPLVEEWNRNGEKMAEVLKELMKLSGELGEGFSEVRPYAETVFYSSWEGIDRIARFYFGDETKLPENVWPHNRRLKDIFDMELYKSAQAPLASEAE